MRSFVITLLQKSISSELDISLQKTFLLIVSSDYHTILKSTFIIQLAPVATWSRVLMVLDYPSTGIMGSNPIPGMDICLYFPVLFCSV